MKKLLFFFIGISLAIHCNAQQDAVKHYLLETGDNAVIYAGKLAESYPAMLFQDLPYWKSESFLSGGITYCGRGYNSLLLRFDVYKEQLTVCSPEKQQEIDLNMPLISAFIIDGDRFVRKEIVGVGIPEEGYLRVLYEGNQIKLLSKQKCILNAAVAQKRQAFTFRTKYYLCMDGKCYPVKNKNSIYKQFPSYKKQLKKYVAEQRCSGKERQMCLAVNYLQSLMNRTVKP